MKYVTLVIVVAVAVLTAAEIKLPNYITPCKAKDELCLKKTLKGLVPRLKEGIPELNIPSFEPASLPEYNQTNFSLEKMSYIRQVKPMNYFGLSNFEIVKFNVDLDALTFNLVVYFQQLAMKAYEIVWAKGFGIDVHAEGLVAEDYNNVTIDFSLKGTKYSSAKGKYIKWAEDHISVSAAGLPVFNVEWFYPPGDGDLYQQWLDRASRDHLDIFKPEIELHIKNTIGLFIFRIINGVHEIIPVDVLYIPDK